MSSESQIVARNIRVEQLYVKRAKSCARDAAQAFAAEVCPPRQLVSHEVREVRKWFWGVTCKGGGSAKTP